MKNGRIGRNNQLKMNTSVSQNIKNIKNGTILAGIYAKTSTNEGFICALYSICGIIMHRLRDSGETIR